MARTKSTSKSSVVDDGAVVKDSSAINNMDNGVEIKNTEVVKPLVDTDEIEVISLIPHVSYQDNRTNDFYEWEQVGHSEFLTYDTLKNMWRNSKGYFKDLWLKPLDDRVINKFGLTKNYKKYELLMNGENYTRATICDICENIIATPTGLKIAVFNKIKSMIANGEITDISVIRTLERYLNLDLISLL
ncbi:MAG: hypothetical protein IJV31_00885 [Clostridia bacterium]|nr:hypothetical protein [Clostridia bacterium]MBQ9657306.1 hypothetical protein [Clostridia bacterium]